MGRLTLLLLAQQNTLDIRCVAFHSLRFFGWSQGLLDIRWIYVGYNTLDIRQGLLRNEIRWIYVGYTLFRMESRPLEVDQGVP